MGNRRVTKRKPKSKGNHTLKVMGGSFFNFSSSTLYQAYKRTLPDNVDSVDMDQFSKMIDQTIHPGDLQQIVIHMIFLLLKLNPSMKEPLQLEIKEKELESDMNLVNERMVSLKEKWNKQKTLVEQDSSQKKILWLNDFILEIIRSCTTPIASTYNVKKVDLLNKYYKAKSKSPDP